MLQKKLAKFGGRKLENVVQVFALLKKKFIVQSMIMRANDESLHMKREEKCGRREVLDGLSGAIWWQTRELFQQKKTLAVKRKAQERYFSSYSTRMLLQTKRKDNKNPHTKQSAKHPALAEHWPLLQV